MQWLLQALVGLFQAILGGSETNWFSAILSLFSG